MNREQVKKLLPILQAFAEGKTIEVRTNPKGIANPSMPNDWVVMDELECWANTEYRIKPTSTYRPFANAEECMTEILKHQPFLKYKCGSICRNVYLSIVKIKLDGIETDEGRYEFNDAMDRFTFADGSVFGVKEESED